MRSSMNTDRGHVIDMNGKNVESVAQAIEPGLDPDNYPLWLATFVDVYQRLATDNLSLLTQVYSPDVHFQDPLHSIKGRHSLVAYFDGLYRNIDYCQFTIDDVLHRDQQAAIYWTMTFIHPSLNRGKPIRVEGHSRLRAEGDKVVYHRDYLDAGAMIYEHVPVLGRLVKMLKQRAGQ